MFSASLEFRFRNQTLCEKRPGGPLWTLSVQKTCSAISRNGRTQSIPFDPKLMFSAFLEFRFQYKKLCEKRPGWPFWTILVRKYFQLNFSQWTHPTHPL